MDKKFQVVAISGSTRAGSYNTALIHAAQQCCPDTMEITLLPIDHLPLYNFDLEQTKPQVITEFKQAILRADAILFASPEYNYSFSGVLKNAIDWASRPISENAWGGKPGAIMGASTGQIGTARMQYHLRQVLTAVQVLTLVKPEIMVASSAEKFSTEGVLTDSVTREKLSAFLTAFDAWIRLVTPATVDAAAR